MELLLIRHGVTAGNLAHRYIGSTDEPLAPEGRAALRVVHLPEADCLWLSPMVRCRESGEILFPGLAPRVVDSLREYNFGGCEGKTWEQVNEPSIYDRWMRSEPDAGFPGGETLETFYTRVTAAVREIAQAGVRLGVRRGAVVAHGGTVMAAMHRFGAPARGGYYDWQLPPGGCFRVQVQENPFALYLLEEIGGT